MKLNKFVPSNEKYFPNFLTMLGLQLISHTSLEIHSEVSLRMESSLDFVWIDLVVQLWFTCTTNEFCFQSTIVRSFIPTVEQMLTKNSVIDKMFITAKQTDYHCNTQIDGRAFKLNEKQTCTFLINLLLSLYRSIFSYTLIHANHIMFDVSHNSSNSMSLYLLIQTPLHSVNVIVFDDLRTAIQGTRIK